MNVDTGEFRALTEQVGALGRKVSALTGRVTVMGNHVNRLDEHTEDDVRMLTRVACSLMEYAGLMRKPAEPPAAPQPERHLHLVRGGEG